MTEPVYEAFKEDKIIVDSKKDVLQMWIDRALHYEQENIKLRAYIVQMEGKKITEDQEG